MSAPAATVTRLISGDYLAPTGHRFGGQRIVAVAYLVRHRDATLLFDTGFPFDTPTSVDEGADALPTFPRRLESLLIEAGSPIADLDLVANCHLHIDHAGGNFRLPGELPIYVQADELAAARLDDDAIVRDALAIEKQAYRPIDGEQEILPGIRLVPTPGHTQGHQSMLVETTDGTVILAGQAVPTATDFASAAYAVALVREGSEPVPPYPAWLPTLLEFEPRRVMFAHDLATWERDL